MVENTKKAKDLEMAEEKAEGVEMGQKKLKGKNTEKRLLDLVISHGSHHRRLINLYLGAMET